MNIIVDQGNTAIKVALFDGPQIALSANVGVVDEIRAILHGRETIANGIYSTVGQSLFEELICALPWINWMELDQETQLPIENCYASRETLGVDRIAAAVGATCLFPNTEVLVIDAGTALTYEYVSASDKYLGGAISPGLQMRFNALHFFTARLPQLYPSCTSELIGVDTKSSMEIGVQNGICREIDGVVEQYKLSHPVSEVILTGGDCAFFDKRLKSPIFAAPELVLIGLNKILNYTIEKTSY